MIQNKYIVLMTVVFGLNISGCDKVRHTFGLNHAQVDPFSVPTNPPLSMPPDYNLRPPLQGAVNPAEVNHLQQAQEKMLGKKLKLKKPIQKSVAEKNILQNAKKSAAPDPKIREEIEAETVREKNMSKTAKTDNK